MLNRVPKDEMCDATKMIVVQLLVKQKNKKSHPLRLSYKIGIFLNPPPVGGDGGNKNDKNRKYGRD